MQRPAAAAQQLRCRFSFFGINVDEWVIYHPGTCMRYIRRNETTNPHEQTRLNAHLARWAYRIDFLLTMVTSGALPSRAYVLFSPGRALAARMQHTNAL